MRRRCFAAMQHPGALPLRRHLPQPISIDKDFPP